MSEPQYITLETWAAGNMEHPASLWTLRSMVRAGRFDPPAVKIGKAYYVEAGARVVDPNARQTLVQRLKQA